MLDHCQDASLQPRIEAIIPAGWLYWITRAGCQQSHQPEHGGANQPPGRRHPDSFP
jgi:hypothetical protein